MRNIRNELSWQLSFESYSDCLCPWRVLYLIIRQAVLSALRKFYRELDETGKKKIQAQANP